MNPNIAKLARLPRGKPFQSRLEPFTEKIRDWRTAGEPYRRIADHLEKLGLKISPAAVHNFVRVRDRQRNRRLYVLPAAAESRFCPSCESARETSVTSTPRRAPSNPDLSNSIADIKHVYIPPPKTGRAFNDDDLALTDPWGLS